MVESYKSNPTVYRVERATMGQDFTKGLNVCIGNYGYYNEGSLHDAWITLPKTEAEIRDFLHLNQLQDSQHEEIYISDYDGIPFGTRLLFNEFCHLEDLNLLAKQLVTANPADLEKVGAWIQANDTPESLVGLMNLIEQADDIPFYSWGYDGAYDKDEFGNMIYTTMSPERNYGYEMVEQNEELKHILDSSSQIESAFDYEKYGRAYTEGGEVTVLEDGYIDNCADGPDEDYYDRDELVSLIGDRLPFRGKLRGQFFYQELRCTICRRLRGSFHTILQTWYLPNRNTRRAPPHPGATAHTFRFRFDSSSHITRKAGSALYVVTDHG